LLIALGAAALTVLSVAGPQPAYAQDKKITLVVPFAAGGSLDALARMIGQKIAAVTGQSLVVENKVGAGGNLGARTVAAADPDGNTLLYTSTGIAINPYLYANPGYSIADLTPIIIPAANTTLFAVNPSNPAQNLTQFLANARTKSFTFGTAGVGTGGYLTGEYFFRSVAKVDAIHTPFAGGAPAVNALLGNHIDTISVAISDGTSQVKAGTLRGIAVASAKRATGLPDVPTIAEQGFPGFDITIWTGLFAPAKTNPEYLAKLNQAVNELLKEPEFQARLATLGFDATPQTLPEARKFLASESEKWKTIVNAVGLKVN
jgi:tripartite-type tricarboxylate transporter receptor subunit TctC